MRAPGIGIIGIGKYLPPHIRQNSDWPTSFTTPSPTNAEKNLTAFADLPKELVESESGRITLEELAKWKADPPFHGAKERRIAAAGMTSSEMEVAAAEDALRVTGLKPSDIGMLLLYSFTPDEIMPDNAGLVHKRLGLPQNCYATSVSGACGSFLLQLQLAAPYLLHTRAKYALLVQSSLQSTVAKYDEPVSATFGDAATAVVLGSVAKDHGILSCATSVDGTYAKTVVIAPDGDSPWHEAEGRMWYTSRDYPRTRELIFKIAEMARETSERTLREAELRPTEIDVFTSHQTVAAFSRICQRGARMDHAPLIDTFAEYGSMVACTLPINLATGRERGVIKPGHKVALFSTGAGFSWSSAIIRW